MGLREIQNEFIITIISFTTTTNNNNNNNYNNYNNNNNNNIRLKTPAEKGMWKLWIGMYLTKINSAMQLVVTRQQLVASSCEHCN